MQRTISQHRRLRLRFTAMAAVIIALSTSVSALAEEPTEAQILNALKPKSLTRGLSPLRNEVTNSEDERFIDTLRAPQTRSLTTKEREQVSVIVKDKPTIDLEINFDFNSDVINPRGLSTVNTLGRALSNPEIKGTTFLVAGHTDAKGGEAYNLGLSERRAIAVKRFLVEKFSLSAETLVTVGYGKEKLKNSSSPFGAENRRVQVVTLADKKTASQSK